MGLRLMRAHTSNIISKNEAKTTKTWLFGWICAKYICLSMNQLRG